MKEVHKTTIRIGVIIASYLPIFFRFIFFEYESFWYHFVVLSADVVAISFFWLILSSFPQGILRGLFPAHLSSTLHKWIPPIAAAILLIHPIGNAIQYKNWKILVPFLHDEHWLISLGSIALIILLVTVLAPYFLKKKHAPWEAWNYLHYFNYFFFVLIYIHALGSIDLSTPTGLYYILLFTFGLIAIGLKLFFDLKLLSLRVKIAEKEKVATKTYNLVLNIPKQLAEKWQPGQHVMLGLARFGDNHPYSISKINKETGTIEVTYKVSGNFTKTLAKKRKGSWIYLYGAFGNFGENIREGRGPIVFIAGGVGITPFRAMLHQLLSEGMKRKIYLFHGCKKKDDFMFHDEFMSLHKKHKNFHYICVCEIGPMPKTMEKGYVSKKILQNYVGSLKGKHYYIIGPPIMMNALSEMLEDSGVPKKNINIEKF